MIEREPVTVVCSAMGWIRAMQGHLAADAELKFKDGDGPRFFLHAETTDRLLLFASNGRMYTLAAAALPGGRGMGEPVRLMVDLPNEAQSLALFVHVPGGRLLVASEAGDGFVLPEDEAVAQTRAGRQVLNLGRAPAPGSAGRSPATTSRWSATNRKLLVFPRAELPEMGRGKGVRLQRYKDGGLADALDLRPRRRACLEGPGRAHPHRRPSSPSGSARAPPPGAWRRAASRRTTASTEAPKREKQSCPGRHIRMKHRPAHGRRIRSDAPRRRSCRRTSARRSAAPASGRATGASTRCCSSSTTWGRATSAPAATAPALRRRIDAGRRRLDPPAPQMMPPLGDRERHCPPATFAPPPSTRWCLRFYPDGPGYFRHFPGFLAAFGGRAFAAGVVDPVDAARLERRARFPPGLEPDADGMHPHEPHWYRLVGVGPEAQCAGLGSTLLQLGLDRADAERMPAFLEATNRRNAALYARHSFGAVGVVEAPGYSEVMPLCERAAEPAGDATDETTPPRPGSLPETHPIDVRRFRNDTSKEMNMLQTFRSAIRGASERARHRREYTALLALDDHLLRDIGVGRHELRARLGR